MEDLSMEKINKLLLAFSLLASLQNNEGHSAAPAEADCPFETKAECNVEFLYGTTLLWYLEKEKLVEMIVSENKSAKALERENTEIQRIIESCTAEGELCPFEPATVCDFLYYEEGETELMNFGESDLSNLIEILQGEHRKLQKLQKKNAELKAALESCEASFAATLSPEAALESCEASFAATLSPEMLAALNPDALEKRVKTARAAEGGTPYDQEYCQPQATSAQATEKLQRKVAGGTHNYSPVRRNPRQKAAPQRSTTGREQQPAATRVVSAKPSRRSGRKTTTAVSQQPGQANPQDRGTPAHPFYPEVRKKEKPSSPPAKPAPKNNGGNPSRRPQTHR
jgi:hypothetical protein